MSKRNVFKVSGVDEILAVFDLFEKREANKLIKGVVRAELKPLATEIKNNFPKDTGATAKEIKVRAGKKRGAIAIDIKGKDDNYIVKFIEYGTFDKNGNQLIKPHLVYKEVFDRRSETVKANIIRRITAQAVDRLNGGT